MNLREQIENLVTNNQTCGIPLIDEIVSWERKQRGFDSQCEPSRMATSDEIALIRFLSQEKAT